MKGAGRVFVALTTLLALAALSAPAQAVPRNAGGQTTVVVATLPAVPGFVFRYQGKLYTTRADGTVVVPRVPHAVVPVIRPLTLTVPLPHGGQAGFDRWYGLSSLDGGSGTVTAAMRTSHPVRFVFSNLQDVPVARADLGQVQIKSSTGFLASLPTGSDTALLQATRVVRDSSGLVVKNLYYTVQNVDVEGNNVVNRSQTKFFPSHAAKVAVPLLFFDASVRARDALFNFAVAGELKLEYPNGRTAALELGPDGRVGLPGLPRGQYHLSVAGPGLKLVQPVVMSRPQNVDLKIFTWLDLAAVATLGLLLAIGLVLVGRLVHRRRLARQQATGVTAAEPVVEPTPPAAPEPVSHVIVLPDAEPERLVPEQVLVLAGTAAPTSEQAVARPVSLRVPLVNLDPPPVSIPLFVLQLDEPKAPSEEPPKPSREAPRAPHVPQVYGPFVIRATKPSRDEESETPRSVEGKGPA